jgi:hypothetical protein
MEFDGNTYFLIATAFFPILFIFGFVEYKMYKASCFLDFILKTFVLILFATAFSIVWPLIAFVVVLSIIMFPIWLIIKLIEKLKSIYRIN